MIQLAMYAKTVNRKILKSWFNTVILDSHLYWMLVIFGLHLDKLHQPLHSTLGKQHFKLQGCYLPSLQPYCISHTSLLQLAQRRAECMRALTMQQAAGERPRSGEGTVLRPSGNSYTVQRMTFSG